MNAIYLWNCKDCKKEYLDHEVPIDEICMECKYKYAHNNGY